MIPIIIQQVRTTGRVQMMDVMLVALDWAVAGAVVAGAAMETLE